MTMTDTGQGTPPPTLRVNTDSIPAELTVLDRWVLWRWEYRKKWTKPPYRPDGRNAKSTDPSTWSTFATVHRAYQSGGFAGIGFVLVDDDDIVGVDLDHCVTDGDASDETLSIVAKLGSYTRSHRAEPGSVFSLAPSCPLDGESTGTSRSMRPGGTSPSPAGASVTSATSAIGRKPSRRSTPRTGRYPLSRWNPIPPWWNLRCRIVMSST